MSTWLISANSASYRHSLSFSVRGFIDWRQYYNFEVGDIVYVYYGKPRKTICFKTIVEMTDLTRNNFVDDKEYWLDLDEYEKGLKHNRFVRLRLITKTLFCDDLDLEHLRAHGFQGTPQGGRKLKKELADYIEDCVKKYEAKYEMTLDSSDIDAIAEALREHYIDFDDLENMAYKKPLWFSLYNTRRDVDTWTDLFVSICGQLVEMYPLYFGKEVSYGQLFGGPKWIEDYDNAHLLSAPKKISDEYVIATNYDSNTILKRIKKILDGCGVDYSDVVICYGKKESGKRNRSRGDLYLRDDEIGFYTWMVETNRLSDSTVKSYFTYLRTIERFLQRNNLINTSLYELDSDEFDELITDLLGRSDFLKENEGKIHIIKSATKKLESYLQLHYSDTEEDEHDEWEFTPVLFPETVLPDESFEGAKEEITVNRYERDPRAREMCISHYGCRCMVCGMDFEENYGEIGKGFIHVHHIVPLKDIGYTHEVDYIKDLIPVCPNCHAMLHRGPNGSCLSADELREMIISQEEE